MGVTRHTNIFLPTFQGNIFKKNTLKSSNKIGAQGGIETLVL
jgi:hypothetical protein